MANEKKEKKVLEMILNRLLGLMSNYNNNSNFFENG